MSDRPTEIDTSKLSSLDAELGTIVAIPIRGMDDRCKDLRGPGAGREWLEAIDEYFRLEDAAGKGDMS